MKKFLAFLGVCVFFFTAAIIISCEGPAGPQGEIGPQGPIGATGLTGEQGIQGEDGTATCVLCHDNSQVNFSKTIQWEASVHATGGNFERNGTNCAPCHTSQGFIETLSTGLQETAADIKDPNPINCYTCHAIHSTYTTDDWDLNVETAVTFLLTGETFNFGTSNLCATCHQSRDSYALASLTALPDDSLDISSRYGAHHGPQGSMFAGTGGVEFVGTLTYTDGSHTTMITNACVTCHMADAYGVQAGGHTMKMEYEYHSAMEVNQAGCVACHTDEDALILKIETTEDEIDALITTLLGALVNRGVMTADSSIVSKKMKEIEAGAIWNWFMVEEDRSNGSHNGPYAKALLQNSIEAINAL